MSLQIDYDKIDYNLAVTHDLISFKAFIDQYEEKVNQMPSSTKELANRKEINQKTVRNLRLQFKSFSDMLWENIHLIETIVGDDPVKLKKLREQYEKCRNNIDTIRS